MPLWYTTIIRGLPLHKVLTCYTHVLLYSYRLIAYVQQYICNNIYMLYKQNTMLYYPRTSSLFVLCLYRFPVYVYVYWVFTIYIYV